MYKIKTLNKISKKGLGILGKNYEISDDCENPDGIILRSFKMHDMELPESLRAVARAGAGVNNIPLDKCCEKGIVVFNTPGANANAVKELVICSLLLSSRKVVQGINWAKTLKDEGDQAASLVEKGKSNFVGPEIYGKTLGVVGLGAIGVKVANAAHHLGMNVVGYDPYLSVDSAWHLTRFAEKATSFDDLLAQSDYITIHVPALPSTIGMFNSEAFAKMKKGARLLNFSRDTLVDTTDIQAALEDGTVSCYVTDFATADLLNNDKVICMPHLGASTEEAEDNCARMAVVELMDYIDNGNIVNSVNYPACQAGVCPEGMFRIAVLYNSSDLAMGSVTEILEPIVAEFDMVDNQRDEHGYALITLTENLADEVLERIAELDGAYLVRRVK